MKSILPSLALLLLGILNQPLAAEADTKTKKANCGSNHTLYEIRAENGGKPVLYWVIEAGSGGGDTWTYFDYEKAKQGCENAANSGNPGLGGGNKGKVVDFRA